jgi:uncharacterized protein YqeY
MLRDEINEGLKAAMKAGDAPRRDALRLMSAAIKDRDIVLRGEGKPLTEEDIVAVLGKMVKSRQESMEIYDKNGRPELAAKERGEIAVISEFLPKAMGEDDVAAAIKAAIAETGATSPKDMGKVIAAMKAKHAGQIDFGKASGLVKAALAG